MPRRSRGELNERRRQILKIAVQEYILTGEPVASQRLREKYDLDVSSATIRNDLAWLEERGFLYQPHLSSGRIPTDEGYRFYVRTLSGLASLAPDEKRAIRKLMSTVTSEIEDIYRRAADIIAELTCCFGLTVAAVLDRSLIKHVDLVRLGPRAVLALLILDTGEVIRSQFELSHDVSELDIEAAEQLLARHLVDKPLVELIEGEPVFSETTGRLAREALAALRQKVENRSFGNVYLSRNVDLTTNPELAIPERMVQLMHLFSRQAIFLRLAREALKTESLIIKIGESQPELIREFSFIAAPYRARGIVGAIGVLGPKRMDYERAIAVVSDVSRLVSRRIYEIFEA